MRSIALAFVLCLTIAAGSAEARLQGAVPCRDSIDRVGFPHAGSDYRLVLGAVSVPPRYVGEPEDTGRQPWRYWLKAGIVVRGGSPDVTITVARDWRRQVAIGWGNREGALSRLTIAGCGSNPNVGFAYAGGLVLRVPSACVPLVVRVGARTTMLRFGIGRRCA